MTKKIPLKQLCRDLNLEPKATRVLLRQLTPHQYKKRWEWDKEEYEIVKQKIKEHQNANP